MGTRAKMPCVGCRHEYWDHDYDEATQLLKCTKGDCTCPAYEKPL